MLPLIAAALPYLGTAAAGLFSGWAGQKIANRGQGAPTIKNRMEALAQKQAAQSGIPGLRGSWGKEGGPVQFPMYSPEQMGMQQQVGQMGLKGLQNTNLDFGPIKQATMEDFYQQYLPSIAERFASAEGEQRSGQFLNQIGSAGKQLETQLAAMQQGFNQQNVGPYLQMLGLGNQPQYENAILSAQPSGAQQFGMSALKYLPGALATAGSAYMGYKGNQALANAMLKK